MNQHQGQGQPGKQSDEELKGQVKAELGCIGLALAIFVGLPILLAILLTVIKLLSGGFSGG